MYYLMFYLYLPSYDTYEYCVLIDCYFRIFQRKIDVNFQGLLPAHFERLTRSLYEIICLSTFKLHNDIPQTHNDCYQVANVFIFVVQYCTTLIPRQHFLYEFSNFIK